MAIRTVKVSNVSLSATEQDIKEFFSSSDEIEYVEMHSSLVLLYRNLSTLRFSCCFIRCRFDPRISFSENEQSQTAHVTFKDPQGAETAVLLSGATIVDQSVALDLEPDYKLPPAASATPIASENRNAGSAVQKAEDVVTSMLAKGFILGKDAVNKAKTFEEKHQFTSTATAKVVSLDQKIGISEKISMGTTMVNDKMKEMDQKFQVSEKTKSAVTAAEQTVSTTGSAVMKNRYILTGTSWVTGAFNKVAKTTEEVGQKSQKTKEQVAEEEQGRYSAQGDSQIHDS